MTLFRRASPILAAASLAASAFADTSGPFEPLAFGEGIEFKHPDGKYQANFRFRMQNLAEATTRSANDLAVQQIEARVRRLRLRLSGYAADPRLTFQLQLSFSREDQDWDNTRSANVVRDANASYALLQEEGRSLTVSFGQAKLPGNRQRVTSSGELQFPDRSLVNRTFNIDRDFGIQLLYRRPSWNARAAVGTGEGRNLPSTSDHGLVYVGRLEALPFGAFAGNQDYSEGDLARTPEPRLGVGASVARFENSSRAGGSVGTLYTTTGDPATGDPIRRDQTVVLADATAKWRGYSVYAEYARRTSRNGAIDASRSLFLGEGWLLQGGTFVGERTELVARHARVRPFAPARFDPRNLSVGESTLGLNHYFSGHRVKIQTDLTRQSLAGGAWTARLNLELGI